MKKILIVGLGPGHSTPKSFQNLQISDILSDLNMRKIVNKNFKLFKNFRNLILQ